MTDVIQNVDVQDAVPFSAVQAQVDSLSYMDRFRLLPPEERTRRLAKLPSEQVALLPYLWEFWARPNQREPVGHWIHWLVKAGRGFGKTRVGVEQVRKWSWEVPVSHVIASTAGDWHKVILDGPAGFYKMTTPQERPRFKTTDSTLYWPNGHRTLFFSAEEPERLRGPQCYKMWCDEMGAWKYAEKTWDNAIFGLRLGDNPQSVITTTPRNIKILKDIMKRAGTVVTHGTTYENKHNLSPVFLSEIITKYKGTRLGRQELDGELLEDNPGALWTMAMIDADRVEAEYFWKEVHPALVRVVTGVDPAVTSNEDSDETGIVTVGRDKQRVPHYYVFDDRSCVERPEGWASRAVAAYKAFKADRIVGEVNNGGEMVETTIHHVDPNASFKAVHASRGKITRAEPISALYEQHRVHHVGSFAALEDQMCDYNPATASFSPDRMDALVWGITDLSEGGHGVLDYWDEMIDAKKAAPKRDVPAYVQSAEEKEEMGLRKISTISSLHKPAVSTLVGKETKACPNCGNTGLSRFMDGAWKCGACQASGRDDWEGMQMKKSL